MLVLLFLLLTGTDAFHTNITVGLTPSPLVAELGPNFVGFSVEVSGILGMVGSTGTNSKFARVLQNLADLTPEPHAGPVLRIGGNSADDSCYESPNTGAYAGCKHNITAADLLAYKTFAMSTAAAANVSYVIDTNFGLSPDPQLVATGHIKALGEHGLWPFVKSVEVGNEVDIYAKPGNPAEQKAKGHRNMSYGYAYYEPEFASFVSAFRTAGMPERSVQGATYASFKADFSGNVSSYISKHHAELSSFSWHRYPISHCNGRNVTQADLLADHAVQSQADELGAYARLAEAANIPFWVGEGNSCSCGGMPGVSDTFTTALWVVDFLPALAAVGARGMNFHGGPRGVYPAVGFEAGGGLEVRPLYYGLLMFSEFAANYSRLLPTTAVSDGGGVAPGGDPTCGGGIQAGGVCCLATCGSCGGVGCNDRPGGSGGCCSGAIAKANVSCDASTAPCVIDSGLLRDAVHTHSAVDTAGNIKVIAVAKALREAEDDPRTVNVCLNLTGSAGSPRVARLMRLVAPVPSSAPDGTPADATHRDGITWAGQTFSTSADGSAQGSRHWEAVQGALGGMQECFAFQLPPLSAAMLVVPAPRGRGS